MPGLGPELELFFNFFFSLFFFGGGLWKSRGHGHGHGHGREPILAILKLFLLKSMFFIMKFNSNLSPFKIEKNVIFSRFFDFLLSGSDFGNFEAFSLEINVF